MNSERTNRRLFERTPKEEVMAVMGRIVREGIPLEDASLRLSDATRIKIEKSAGRLFGFSPLLKQLPRVPEERQSYNGKDRRVPHTSSTLLFRQIAGRVVRECTPLDSLDMRKGDPRSLCAAVKAYAGRLFGFTDLNLQEEIEIIPFIEELVGLQYPAVSSQVIDWFSVRSSNKDAAVPPIEAVQQVLSTITLAQARKISLMITPKLQIIPITSIDRYYHALTMCRFCFPINTNDLPIDVKHMNDRITGYLVAVTEGSDFLKGQYRLSRTNPLKEQVDWFNESLRPAGIQAVDLRQYLLLFMDHPNSPLDRKNNTYTLLFQDGSLSNLRGDCLLITFDIGGRDGQNIIWSFSRNEELSHPDNDNVYIRPSVVKEV